MDSAYSGLDLLQGRFPDLAFLLMVEGGGKLSLTQDDKGYWHAEGKRGALYEEDVAKEIEKWKKTLPLEEIEAIYIYGIGLGYHYEALTEWLEGKKERQIIFLEDDLAVLETLFSLPLGQRLLQETRVHITYLPDSASLEAILDEQVVRVLSDKVEFSALSSYRRGQEKKVRKWRLELLRKSTLVYVGMAELLHYHVLMENITSNMRHLPSSFHMNQWKDAFRGVPAIICGAGASLKESIPLLRGLEQKALIFAGGSAIAALSHEGVRPHLAMALDPNEEEYARLKGGSCFEVPFIYSARLHKGVLPAFHCKAGYLCSGTGGSLESWLHEALSFDSASLGPELGAEALSVTTLAVPLARHLGCYPILFCGVDLSYQKKQRYAPGVATSSQVLSEELRKERRAMEMSMQRKNQQGTRVETQVKWVMEAACLGAYAKDHKEISFFNASPCGLPISHVPFLPMETFIERYCSASYDLRGQLQVESELTSLALVAEEEVEAALSRLQESLRSSFLLFEEMFQEIERYLPLCRDLSLPAQSGKMRVIEMDLHEEPAYVACLEGAFLACQRLLHRHDPSLDSPKTEEERVRALESKRHLWRECLSIAKECLALLEGKKDVRLRPDPF